MPQRTLPRHQRHTRQPAAAERPRAYAPKAEDGQATCPHRPGDDPASLETRWHLELTLSFESNRSDWAGWPEC